MFSRDFPRGPTWHVHPTVDFALNFYKKKYPFMFLVPWIFPRGVLLSFCTVMGHQLSLIFDPFSSKNSDVVYGRTDKRLVFIPKHHGSNWLDLTFCSNICHWRSRFLTLLIEMSIIVKRNGLKKVSNSDF